MFWHATFTLLVALGVSPIRARSSLSAISQEKWDALSKSVGGRVHDGEPFLAPCYDNYNGKLKVPDYAECTLLQSNRSSSVFIAGYFGGYQNANWGSCQATGAACVLDTLINPDLSSPVALKCEQGSVPNKYLEVQSVADVQAGVNFARENNLTLVIKNTGHDYKGRSSAPDSFALWTHNYQPPLQLQQNFIPAGCSSAVGDVITFGAGQQFEGIYEFAHEHNYRVVGGTSNSVGAAGGWITGGGHSMLSNELGLGVDNVQQLKAVLPNGTYVTANRCQNQDIFFALRGGGGGTFGVVMEMSTLAHPEKPVQLAEVIFASMDNESAQKFLDILVANADRWASEGWGGYISPGLLGNQVSNLLLATSLLNQTAAEVSMKPVLDFARQQGTIGIANVTTSPTYFAMIKAIAAAAGLDPLSSMAMSSRIVRRESFLGAANQTKLSTILNDILTTSQKSLLPDISPLFISVTSPTIYSQTMPASDQPGGPGASSVTPAWRDGIWHVIHLSPFDAIITDPSIVNGIWQKAHDTMNPLREFTPDSGAYQNEADTFENDPISTFWGRENYERLLRIKKVVDPTNLLTVHQGVGWDRTEERFQCYPDVSI
ncbi:FAD-binding domain-containing protein [Aspergillus heteromorphus CBS 117.55]|uniref:FAD-binding domain-containing protein n=1 Tax=Aspergillus heteromorphus CBS 117.55 TaxID=1448321 RepID=A0A317W8V9_9EURO|nr:FAD-binding domain-containing protein [Aspergillus heteromorphus CBS 117.55]PWY82171.1 FAD-binding domain-containing protein [Aspergillus heteromorphus CBS 117.55]